MDLRWLHRRVFEGARELIPGGQAVICAASGGPDSMAMLYALAAVNERKRCEWKLHAAYLDHGMHARSAEAEKMVRSACATLSIPLTCARVDVPKQSRLEGKSLEEAARDARYAFLQRVAKDCGAKVVAVAHHADDQAETVLHRILRGTGLRGLGGMRRSRRLTPGGDVRVVRPLLALTHADLVQYLEQRRITYFCDPTNDDAGMATRNRIRHELIPMLEKAFNPKVRRSLARLAHQAADSEAALRRSARSSIKSLDLQEHDGVPSLDVTNLAPLPRAVQAEVIRWVLRRANAAMKKIGHERISAVLSLTRGPRQKRSIELPGGTRVERRGSRLSIHSPGASHKTFAQASRVTEC